MDSGGLVVSGKRRVVVIGGGIAGVSIAGELSHDHDVVVIEAEDTLAHHTTGRSAAVLLPGYGNKVVRELTQRSIALYAERSKKYEVGLLEPRAFLQIAGADRADMLREIVEKTPTMHMIDIEDAFAMCPYLQRDAVAAAAIDETGSAIDVASLHQTYVREIAANGGVIVKNKRVNAIALGNTCVVSSGEESWECDLVVNAAGAWGDVVAAMAHCKPVGLMPLRRTIFTAKVDPALGRGPMVFGTPEAYYFGLDHGVLLGSPADETLSEPCDARPEEIDVAQAIESVNEVTTFNIRSIDTAWAGLRTFAPDRSPVVGSRVDEPNFFWFCGQGGYGIQMGPGLAEYGAFLARGLVPEERGAAQVDADRVSPNRFP